MARTKISEFSATPANNTDIDSINIAEGCAPSGINDAIRELMSQLKDWQSGTSNDPYVVGSSGSLTLSGGTANGVAYLNGSKVVTSGSALTFDGTTFVAPITSLSGNGVVLTVDRTGTGGNDRTNVQFSNSGTVRGGIGTVGASDGIYFNQGTTEGMRLTSTGLGIGTSSPSQKLHVVAAGGYNSTFSENSANKVRLQFYIDANETALVSGYDTTAKPMTFYTGGAKVATLDSSGNLGLGVTPSAWGSAYKAIQFNNGTYGGGSFITDNGSPAITANAYNNSGWKYVNTDYATIYQSRNGQHQWFTAPSGTAGNAITFTQAMTLDASGNLGVGTSSPTEKLQANGALRITAGVNNVNGNNGAFFAYESGGVTNIHSFNSSGGSIAFNTNASGGNTTERARIDSSGRLLVGTTTASGSIATFKGSQQSFIIRNGVDSDYNEFGVWDGASDGLKAVIKAEGGVAKFGSRTNSPMAFQTNDTERARIDSSGNLLVGTTSAINSGKISISAALYTASTGISIQNTQTTYGSSTSFAVFVNSGGGTAGNIYQSAGTTVNYNTSSDARLKEDIGVATDTSVIDNTIIHDFTWKADSRVDRGVFAQEAYEVKPSAVGIGKDDLTESGDLVQPWSVDYSKYVPDLIVHAQQLKKQVKEQQAIISAQSAVLESLKARLDAANL